MSRTTVDAKTAALAAGVEVSTLRDWVRRGILPRLGRNRYDLEEVLTAKTRVRNVSSYTTKPLPPVNGQNGATP